MNISLTKLPWYGQVGAFAVLAIGGIGAFIYYYDMPARAEIATRQDQLVVLRKDITRGQNTAKKLPELAKGLGTGIKEFKKATREVTDELSNSIDETPPPPKRLPPSTPQPEPQQTVSQSSPSTKV